MTEGLSVCASKRFVMLDTSFLAITFDATTARSLASSIREAAEYVEPSEPSDPADCIPDPTDAELDREIEGYERCQRCDVVILPGDPYDRDETGVVLCPPCSGRPVV